MSGLAFPTSSVESLCGKALHSGAVDWQQGAI